MNSTKEFADSLPWRVAVCRTLRPPAAALPAELDATQRRCAATRTDPDRLHREQ
ncbi:hypothetical protein AB0958_19380 [Streptomyces sp. NPDC006655]|uniref:hypothetical protein n=1 Tax=Streptomyces sp. NPDC006655 TaxID=3156898 RepID=UPI003456642A